MAGRALRSSLQAGAAVSACVLSLAFSSCGNGDGAEPGDGSQAAREYRIGMCLSMTEDTPFFVSLVQGARESADRLGVTLEVAYAADSLELQISQMRDFVARDVDAILLNPVSDGIAGEVEQTCSQGVPIITIDRRAPGDCILCHIASDNVAGGRMAGGYLAEALHRQGRVVEIMGTEGSSAAADRGRGFSEAIDSYPDIEVVARITADFSRDQAAAAFGRLLETGSGVDAVFAHNDDMILGAIQAAGAAGAADTILFVGFDAISEAILAVETGELLATVAQMPEEMGRLGIETAVEHLEGNPIPDSIIVDLALIVR